MEKLIETVTALDLTRTELHHGETRSLRTVPTSVMCTPRLPSVHRNNVTTDRNVLSNICFILISHKLLSVIIHTVDEEMKTGKSLVSFSFFFPLTRNKKTGKVCK